MYAIEGDLITPSAVLGNPEWYNFDVAIISMALHHVSEPVKMLEQLRARLRSGGSIVVVEFTHADHKDEELRIHKGNPAEMVEVIGGQKIWPDFTPRSLANMLATAGFTAMDVKVMEENVYIPDHVSGVLAGRDKMVMFAKAVTP